jgi:hypothetical protein
VAPVVVVLDLWPERPTPAAEVAEGALVRQLEKMVAPE